MRVVISVALLLFSISTFSQVQDSPPDSSVTYRFIKTDGGELIGRVLESNRREVLIRTEDGREIYLPQHTIKEMLVLESQDFNREGEYIGEDKFATRYFITTNGFPVKKGEHYAQWNLYGPDFQFAVTDNFGAGVMTSWVGIPIVGTAKYSFELREKLHAGVGVLAGFGSWVRPNIGGVLPYSTITVGSRSRNLSVSLGYVAFWDTEDFDGKDWPGRVLTSAAGMLKVSRSFSLVFDSFILLPASGTKMQSYYDPISQDYKARSVKYEADPVALLLPGVRWHTKEGRAFQFGFSAIAINGEFIPVPIPTVQWYTTL